MGWIYRLIEARLIDKIDQKELQGSLGHTWTEVEKSGDISELSPSPGSE